MLHRAGMHAPLIEPMHRNWIRTAWLGQVMHREDRRGTVHTYSEYF